MLPECLVFLDTPDFLLDTSMCYCLPRCVHTVSSAVENVFASSGKISRNFDGFSPSSCMVVAACVSICCATAVHAFAFPIHNVVGFLCRCACEYLFVEKAWLLVQKSLLS